MKSYVYKIKNNTNQKYYIGKSNNPSKRWADHQSISKTGKRGDGTFQVFHAAIKKYGSENFQLIILGEYETEEETLLQEINFIEQARQNGDKIYNLTDGGDGVIGYKHTPESKKIMSEKAFGRIFSPETKLKLSHSLTGKIRSPEHCASISKVKTGLPNPGVGIKNAIKFRGENSSFAILSEQDVINIHSLLKNKIMQKDIAKLYNVHPTTISDIKRGKTWKHLSNSFS